MPMGGDYVRRRLLVHRSIVLLFLGAVRLLILVLDRDQSSRAQSAGSSFESLRGALMSYSVKQIILMRGGGPAKSGEGTT